MNEKIEELIQCLERWQKAGSIREMYKVAKPLSDNEKWKTVSLPTISDGFEELNQACLLHIAFLLEEIEKKISLINYYNTYCEGFYKEYKEREGTIKSPDILKFIKDYENYYKGEE